MPNEKKFDGIHVYDHDTKKHIQITSEDFASQVGSIKVENLIHIAERRAAALKQIGDA